MLDDRAPGLGHGQLLPAGGYHVATLALRGAVGHFRPRLDDTAACCCSRCARFQSRWDEKKALAPAEVAKAVQVGCMHSRGRASQPSYALDVATVACGFPACVAPAMMRSRLVSHAALVQTLTVIIPSVLSRCAANPHWIRRC